MTQHGGRVDNDDGTGHVRSKQWNADRIGLWINR